MGYCSPELGFTPVLRNDSNEEIMRMVNDLDHMKRVIWIVIKACSDLNSQSLVGVALPKPHLLCNASDLEH